MLQKRTVIILSVVLIGIIIASISIGYYLTLNDKPSEEKKQDLIIKLSPKFDNLLKAFNDNDYVALSKDFSSRMRTAFNQTAFNSGRAPIISLFGLYVSKTSVIEVSNSTSGGERFILIVFETKFEKMDPVYVVMSFLDSEPSYPVEGFWFTTVKP